MTDSLLPAVTEALATLSGRMSVVEERLGMLFKQRQAPDDADLVAEGMAAFTALASQVEIAMVEITSLVDTDIFAGKRLQYSDESTVADDDENATPFNIYAAPGTAPFVGCVGLAVLVGVDGVAPIWWMFAGECVSWRGKVTDEPTANKYPWVQTSVTRGLSPLSSTGLGDALDLASVAYDAAITERNDVPVNTIVKMWWDGTQVVFTLGPEPETGLC